MLPSWCKRDMTMSVTSHSQMWGARKLVIPFKWKCVERNETQTQYSGLVVDGKRGH